MTANGSSSPHGSIRPMDPTIFGHRLASEGWPADAIALYEIIRKRDAAQFVGDALVLERRAIAEIAHVICAFALEPAILNDGWRSEYADVAPPLEPTLGSESAEPPPTGSILHATVEPAAHPGTTIAELIASMIANGYGRPSTYAEAITRLTHRDEGKTIFTELTPEGLIPTDDGDRRIASLRAPRGGAPVLDARFNAELERRLDALEAHSGTAESVFEVLGPVVRENDLGKFTWLETLADEYPQNDAVPLVTEKQGRPAPLMLSIEQPEDALASDDALRSARDRLIDGVHGVMQDRWRQMTAQEQAGLMLSLILREIPWTEAIRRRLRFDALFRWIVRGDAATEPRPDLLFFLAVLHPQRAYDIGIAHDTQTLRDALFPEVER